MESRIQLENLSVGDLLRMYRQILKKLMDLDVIRTFNAPTGDYAEFLVAEYFDVERAPNSSKGADVITRGGKRIQVKARVTTGSGRGERQLSVIRDWGFDQLAVVLFGDDYEVRRAALISADLVKDRSRNVPYVQGDRVFATDALLDSPGVADITSELRTIAAGL